MDEDLDPLDRAGIRAHRDASGQELCWHHPQLWGLLPEKMSPAVAVPPWPQFLRGCLKYRESLDRELPDAPAASGEYGGQGGGEDGGTTRKIRTDPSS